MQKRILAIVTITAMFLSGCGSTEYEKYELTPNERFNEITTTDSEGNFVVSEMKQLTEADIQAMNDGKASILYNDEGYVTFINGRYSNTKVANYEDAVSTIQPIAGLLGLNNGAEFFANYYSKDDDGYTYYTFEQRFGDLTLIYSVIKVIVGPDGYTRGIASSFTPNVGVQEDLDEITPEMAIEIIKDNIEESDLLRFYPDETHKVAINYCGKTYTAYAIYADNPFNNTAFQLPYYEFFVTVSGKFLEEFYPVASFGKDNTDLYRNEDYFTNLDTRYYTFECSLYDGSTETVTVPVSINKADGKYYLMDPSRYIAVGDYYDMNNKGIATFYSSDDNAWETYVILAYDKIIKAYDFYKSKGLTSVDGCGIPIFVSCGLTDNNAYFYGINSGWACVAFSNSNNATQCMDIVAHEYTHGITSTALVSDKYLGITGAINESLSDIMGNLIEMQLDATNDTTWLIGENGGYVYRSMSNPRQYNQPTSVYDPLFADPTNLEYDNGGVHRNSSLLSSAAYNLCANGMSLEDATSLWITAIEIQTPLAEYEEFYQILLMSIDINGFDNKYKDVLYETFYKAGMID